MEVSKEILQDLVYDPECEEFEVIREEFEGMSRWTANYSQVLKHKETGKCYLTSYSLGATEMQDESPYEYEPDMIKLTEVVPYETRVTRFKKAA